MMICQENLVPYLDSIVPGMIGIIKKPLMGEDVILHKSSETEDQEVAL